MQFKFITNDRNTLPGKLADAEIHFTDGPLEGLKLIGFVIWERRIPGGGRNVTFPARTYSVNGERRSFALLRPIVDIGAQDRIREQVLEAYAAWETAQVPAGWKSVDTSVDDRRACRCGHTRAQHTADGVCGVLTRNGAAPVGSEQPCGCVAFQVWE